MSRDLVPLSRVSPLYRRAVDDRSSARLNERLIVNVLPVLSGFLHLDHFYLATQLCWRSLRRRKSVTRMLCDKTKQYTADILIPHETAITLVF